MSEPSGGVTLTPGNLAAIGLAVVAVARAVWGAVTSNYKERIAVLEAENKRLLGVVEKLGADKDRMHAEQLRMVGIALARGSEFDELPTGIRTLAELVDPKSTRKSLPARDPHPELEGWDPNLSTPPGLRKR